MENKTYSEKLSQLILKAESEIDELRLKVALGKMNGADIFEDMKKELSTSLREISLEVKEENNEVADSVKSTIENFQNGLTLGKAEVLDEYEDQKKKIASSIDQFDQTIRDSRLELSQNAKLKICNELEKFQLKMEVLQIRYELGRLDLKDNVEDKKQKFRKQFEELLSSIQDETSLKLEAHCNGLKRAYDSLREMINDN